MADEERTEPASSRKLAQAFDEGQVPVGKEVATVIGLSVGVLALQGAGPALRDTLAKMMVEIASGVARPDLGHAALLCVKPALLTLGVSAAIAVAIAAATAFQTRGGMWSNLVFPDFTRLFSVSRVLQMIPFRRETLVNLALAVAKAAAIALIAWSTIRHDFAQLPALVRSGPQAQLAAMFGALSRLGLNVLGALAVLAGLDLFVTRYRFAQRMRMTKDEAKREHKEEEGDPLIRGSRRRRHRELAKQRVAQEVPRADAIVVNPTHIAVAIRYRIGEGAAPRVTAKGKGVLAEHMKDLARSHAIPIYEDPPLARTLYKRVKPGREVPAELYKAVAAVLVFVFRVTGRRPGLGGSSVTM